MVGQGSVTGQLAERTSVTGRNRETGRARAKFLEKRRGVNHVDDPFT